MKLIFCPYLDREVVLTDERYEHIQKHHPELLPEHEHALESTVRDPDSVRRSERFQNARLFTKYFDTLRGGKYTVVVIVNDSRNGVRDWIITAYMARKITRGGVEWERR